jgi:hypothetical protein
MTQERVENSQNSIFYTRLVLPDGLSCKCIYAPSSIDEFTLKDMGQRFVQRVLYSGEEVRICSDDPDKINSLGKFLKGQYPEVPINWGGNTYFEYDLINLPLRKQLSWDQYKDNYVYYPIESRHYSGEFEVVRKLMRDSFNLEDDNAFSEGIQNRQNRIFIVGDTNTGKVLGTFVLVYMPALGEIQLHCVAGRSEDQAVSQQKGKLPIIMSAVLSAIEDEHPQAVPYGIAKNSFLETIGPKRLTFSTSGEKRVAIYEKLGIQKSDRSGVAIKLPVDSFN